MEKSSTNYYANSKDGRFELSVEVNNEVKSSHIKCTYDDCWRSKADTEAYLKWCIKKLEGLKEEAK